MSTTGAPVPGVAGQAILEGGSGDSALVRDALRDAKLADDAAVAEFWGEPRTGGRKLKEAYARYSAEVPVDQGVIFYETMGGDRMNDNPLAIFEELRSHPEYGSYLHVWSLGAHGSVPPQYAALDDVVFAKSGSLAYVYFLAQAGHIIGNANLPDYFTRREGQMYLNTWHGIPYKALGRSIPRAKFGSTSTLGTFLKATHVLSPCEFMTDALISAYSMSGASTAQIAQTGYPRIDLTVNVSAERRSELRRELGIEEHDGTTYSRPVVLYAPTWRTDAGTDTVDADQLTRDLEALVALDIQLMYRGHHRIDRLVDDEAIGDRVGRVITPPKEVSSNELLAVVDILITDYSSIFFDFLPTGRPIVHHLYDLEEYARKRGLNLGVDELPGAVALTAEQLVTEVDRAATALRDSAPGEDFTHSPVQGERYRSAQQRFAPYEDGAASRRAIDFFFRDRTPGVSVRTARDGRPTAVFWAGLLADDAASREFLEKALALAKSPKLQVTLVIDRDSFVERTTLRRLKNSASRVSCIAYDVSEPTLLATQAGAYDAYVAGQTVDFEGARRAVSKDATLRDVFAREYRRRLDDARFDAVFLGPELTSHEAALAGFACRQQGSLGSARKLAAGTRSPVNRMAQALLPKGTARRQRAERAYRSLRKRLAR